MAGYRTAVKEAVKYIKSNLVVAADALGRDILINAAKTSMSSKILHAESAFFADLSVTAVQRVRTDKDGKTKYPIGNIHILKSHGQSSRDSCLVDGFALNCARAAQAMPTKIVDAKVALLDFNLQKHKLQLGVQVVVTDTKQVEEIRQRELDITREKIKRSMCDTVIETPTCKPTVPTYIHLSHYH